MSKTAKTLTILMFLVAIAFLFFSFKTVQRTNGQNDLVVSLQNAIGKQENTISSLQGSIGSARERITALRTRREELTTELKSVIVAKESVEATLAQTQKENKTIGEELDSAKATITKLEAQDQAAQKQIAELTQAQTNLTQSLTAEQQRCDRLAAEIVVTRSQLFEAKRAAVQAIGTPHKMTKPVPEVEGEVVVSSNGVVALSFPGSIHSETGDTYYAIRADRIVGKLICLGTYRTIVISEMGMEDADEEIKQGDKVRLAQDMASRLEDKNGDRK